MNQLDYNKFMSKALQRMIADVLASVAENGLPGDHHFYIQFRTKAKGVVLPEYLASKFPNEMTIALQYEFDNLGVLDDRFCVSLDFDGVVEDLVIPLDAIIDFSDPSVNFSLRFEKTNSSAQGTEEVPSQAPEKVENEGKTSENSRSEDNVLNINDFRKN